MDTYNMTDKQAKAYKRNTFLCIASRIVLFVLAALSLANILFMFTSDYSSNGIGLIATLMPSYVADIGVLLTEETDEAVFTVVLLIVGIVLSLVYALLGILSGKHKKCLIIGFVYYAIECIFFFYKAFTSFSSYLNGYFFAVAILPHLVFLAILIAGGFAAEALEASTLTKRKIKKNQKRKEKSFKKEETDW